MADLLADFWDAAITGPRGAAILNMDSHPLQDT